MSGWDEPDEDDDAPDYDEDDDYDRGYDFDREPEWAEFLSVAGYAEFIEWQYERPDAQIGPF